MKRYVICSLHVKGFHRWPTAPDGPMSYLRYRHRHVFDIQAAFAVADSDREIEIIERQNEMEQYLLSRYGAENRSCEFGSMSCEQIAEDILREFGAVWCVVREDGFGGAAVVR